MIPLTRPTLPKLKSIQEKLRDVFKTGMLTNNKYVKEFEKQSAEFLGVKNVAAVANGTSALILSFKCLDLTGEVIMPSFTFTSGGHALLWCGLKPVFADINRQTFNIEPAQIEKKITKKTSAILATHVFGNPCQIDEIQKIAKKYNLKVIYDAAHAFGSEYKNKSVAQFGDISIFSFTPTKVLTTGEGGLIVAKNKKLSEKLKLARNNGDSINRKEEFLGLTARMPEISAILGIEGLKIFAGAIKKRLKLVDLYKKQLSDVPGIFFQEMPPFSFSVYKDLAIIVDKNKFGISRDELLKELLRRKIESKVYFYPPLHKKKVYKKYSKLSLSATDFVSNRIISLPLYSHMPQDHAVKVCSVIKSLSKKI
ncbi:MAG: DegT/DnrJ/EryC1/StrS family aminotransferase [bacterium]